MLVNIGVDVSLLFWSYFSGFGLMVLWFLSFR